jgi:hypothetical protein
MPILSSDATVTKRSGEEILQAAVQNLRNEFGRTINVQGSGSLFRMFEAFVSQPLSEVENTFEDVYRQRYAQHAQGQALDDAAWPLFIRFQAAKAGGAVNITLTSALAAPDPLFVAGDLTFVDSEGNTYILDADLSPNGTVDVEASVLAEELGAEGNIQPDNIISVRFNNSTAQTNWSAWVGASVSDGTNFRNDLGFSGGADQETDALFRRRMREARSALVSSSPDGIATSVEVALGGTARVSVLENTTDVGSSRDKVFDSDATGTPSETIDGATLERIAFKMALTERRYIQHFTVVVDHGVAPTFDVRLETNSAGEASGALVFTGAQVTGFSPADGSTSAEQLDEGEYVDAGTYWLVFTQTNGDGTFDGATSGTSGDVMVFNGATWANDANINEGNVELIGGLPPHSFRIFASEEADVDTIAQAIWDSRPVGIPPDGIEEGDAVDRDGNVKVQNFDHLVEVPVVVKVTVQHDSGFEGDADTVKDLIVSYIGGNDTGGTLHQGLDVDEALVRMELVQRILDDTLVSGIVDVPADSVLMERRSVRATPGDLTGADVADKLSALTGEVFVVDDVANDIEVVLVSV